MRVVGIFQSQGFGIEQMNGCKLQRLASKLKDIGERPSVTENEKCHWVTEVTKYKQMTLKVTYMFNDNEWESHEELILGYKIGDLAEVVGTGEWL
jgi:outer membrane protein W